MASTRNSIHAERRATHARLHRRQSIVIVLDHIYTAIFYASVVAASLALCIAAMSGSLERLWGVAFGLLCLPHIFDDPLTALMFGKAFNRDHDFLLSLEAEELATLSR